MFGDISGLEAIGGIVLVAIACGAVGLFLWWRRLHSEVGTSSTEQHCEERTHPHKCRAPKE